MIDDRTPLAIICLTGKEMSFSQLKRSNDYLINFLVSPAAILEEEYILPKDRYY